MKYLTADPSVGWSSNDPLTIGRGFYVYLELKSGVRSVVYYAPGAALSSPNLTVAQLYNSGLVPFSFAYDEPIKIGMYLDDDYIYNAPGTPAPTYDISAQPITNFPDFSDPENVILNLYTPNSKEFLFSYEIPGQLPPTGYRITPPGLDVPAELIDYLTIYNAGTGYTEIRFRYRWTDPARPVPTHYRISWGDVTVFENGIEEGYFNNWQNVQQTGVFA